MHLFRNESWPTIMVIGAFAIGVLLGEFPSHGDWQPKWEMVSAIGTIAAAVIALGISLGEGYRRRREAYVRAQLTAARITGHLAMLVAKLGYISLSARQCIDDNAPVSICELLLNQLLEIDIGVTDDELLVLEPLPNQSAFLLAGAKGSIASAKNYLSMVCGPTYPEKRARIDDALQLVEFLTTEAQLQISKAMVECQKACLAETSPHS
ncbi:hypothetical protein AZSI13_32650 [Azospira sp. I13]|uniref:hypothetical protein n=1 Tax=Azospira sp. I13 TaxID=1765050 RepID=UPI000D4B95D3|nr:hypothetical protein [Azospira sp. I13]GBG03938.1 hypothetical protein AZSI13_32650 [Azospira sp. I13]